MESLLFIVSIPQYAIVLESGEIVAAETLSKIFFGSPPASPIEYRIPFDMK